MSLYKKIKESKENLYKIIELITDTYLKWKEMSAKAQYKKMELFILIFEDKMDMIAYNKNVPLKYTGHKYSSIVHRYLNGIVVPEELEERNLKSIYEEAQNQLKVELVWYKTLCQQLKLNSIKRVNKKPKREKKYDNK